jgi:signal transduction histidine kinase/CheY-like chemotaxis protein
MKLRSQLLVFALATLLPLVAFAVLLSGLLVERERDTFRRGAADRARAILTAVDLQLTGVITALDGLALSRALDDNDLAAFHTQAQRVLASRPDWRTLQLSDIAAAGLVDASVTYGSPLPMFDGAPYAESVVRDRAPTVGALTRAAGMSESYVPVVAPVMRYGDVRYLLSATVAPAAFNDLLAQQKLPDTWVGAVLDGGHRVVARTRDAERYVGALATPDLRRELDAADAGWYVGTTLEGVEVYVAYQRSPATRWTVSLGVPVAVLDAGATRTRWLMSLGLVLALGLALLLATLFSRRLAAPLAAVADAADAIGRGDPVTLREAPNIAELRHLTASLDAAASAVRTRESEQRAAEDALRAANRQKDDFLAMLGHELRNPLSAIASASQILRRAQQHPDLAANASGVIDRQVGHMARLIDDLLDVSRVTRGAIEIVRRPLDLGAAVSGVIDAWRAAGRFDEHTLEADVRSAWILGDASRVDQMITNLLENALKYTPAGGRIHVTVRRAGARTVFEVSDTGVGLSPELAARMFDLFVQGERPLDRRQGGLGIGLTLVKRLAELHGATVAGTSDGPGHGARFTVQWPAIDAPAIVASPVAPTEGERTSRRILVVEDNDDAREALVQLLALGGHDVRAARDADAALEAVRGFTPDVALLDIGLPGVDGYALAAALRERLAGSTPRLVALTGYGQPEDFARSRAAGFDEHLVKPVSTDALARVIAAR